MAENITLLAAVSVVIPCYKCSLTIERAIESIASQTLKPVEVILIDDASDDGTLACLTSLEKRYPGWVKIIALPQNVGAASARNVGWEAASQPYIAFLDSDDAWHPRKIEIQYKYMSEHPDVAMSGHRYIELAKNEQGFNDLPVECNDVEKITWHLLLFKNQFVTPSVMLKKEITFRFKEGRRYMEDHLLWLEIVGGNCKVVKLNCALTAIFKPMFGASGLSSNLFEMAKSDLANYYFLQQQKKLSLHFMLIMQTYSLIKFVRRLVIVYLFRRS